jgi:hypothetical protein
MVVTMQAFVCLPATSSRRSETVTCTTLALVLHLSRGV